VRLDLWGERRKVALAQIRLRRQSKQIGRAMDGILLDILCKTNRDTENERRVVDLTAGWRPGWPSTKIETAGHGVIRDFR